MLIKSKFRDYYDNSASYGIDKTVVYSRDTIKDDKLFHEKFKERSYRTEKYFYPKSESRYRMYRSDYNTDNYTVNTFLIAFCGKYYPGYKFVKTNEEHIFYSKEEVIDFYNKNNMEIEKDRRGFFSGVNSLVYMEKFFDRNTWKYLDELFQEFKVPVFALEGKTIINNPVLKDYKFGKVKKSPEAFQDIFMYISGVLGTNENEMINISDEDKRDKKGFDKWSFKKLPTKKK
tara:strand:+ start:16908 stop:17600 length:693 start_codon:yes stop_codon:yes gene_type:complete